MFGKELASCNIGRSRRPLGDAVLIRESAVFFFFSFSFSFDFAGTGGAR